MRVFFLVCILALTWCSPLATASAERTILILYNHGTSSENNCRRSALGHAELPKWARMIDGMRVIDPEGYDYTIEVEFLCTNEDPGSFESDASACDLTVCKRANNIARAIDNRAGQTPRRQIFLAGQSAGAWASLLIKRKAPHSVNGLILTAPAFGGKRKERTCPRPTCDQDDAPAMRRMTVRADHEKQIAGQENDPPLEALIAAFPCDNFGWPSELPVAKDNGAEVHTFPSVGPQDEPLACAQRTEDRYFNEQPHRFCQKIHNRDDPGTPVCSEKRIAFCPEQLSGLCKDPSHSFFDDFTEEFPWLLNPPVFADWFVGEGLVQAFIEERLASWHYGEGTEIEGPICGFMARLPMCR